MLQPRIKQQSSVKDRLLLWSQRVRDSTNPIVGNEFGFRVVVIGGGILSVALMGAILFLK